MLCIDTYILIYIHNDQCNYLYKHICIDCMLYIYIYPYHLHIQLRCSILAQLKLDHSPAKLQWWLGDQIAQGYRSGGRKLSFLRVAHPTPIIHPFQTTVLYVAVLVQLKLKSPKTGLQTNRNNRAKMNTTTITQMIHMWHISYNYIYIL